jgi:galactokinase
MLSPVGYQPEMIPFEDHAAIADATRGFFADDAPVWVARAPGRLDVMGGNVDYTGGLVLQSLLREAIWVAVQVRTDDTIRVFNPGAAQHGWEPSLEVCAGDLANAERVRELCGRQESLRWGCYVLGALHYLKTCHGRNVRCGMDLFIASNLPPNKGVSSSAALEVAVLKAASGAWGIRLEGVELATAGQWVENVVVGSACGIMDQAAIVLGEENHLLPMLCQPCLPGRPIRLPDGMRIWGIDSMVSRSTTGAPYETARAAAFVGYRLICEREGVRLCREKNATIPRWTDSRWGGYLSNLAPPEFRSGYEPWLPESLTGREILASAGEHPDPFTTIDPDTEYPVRAAVRYAVEENFRVGMVRELLGSAASASSYRLIGEILCQSHAAYTECGLGSDACDELVERALAAGFPGAKMTGGGAGGVVAVLGRPGSHPEDRQAIYAIAEECGAGRGAMPHIFEGSSCGLDAFGARTMQGLR